MFVTKWLGNPVENNLSGSPKKTTLLNKLLQAFNKREANAKEFNEAIFFITLIVIVHSLSGVASCICFNTPFGVKLLLCLLNLAMLFGEVCLLKVFTKPTDIILDGNQSSRSILKNKPIFIAYAESPDRNPVVSLSSMCNQKYIGIVDKLTAAYTSLLRENTVSGDSFSKDDLKKKLNNYFTAHRELFAQPVTDCTLTARVENIINEYSADGVYNIIKHFIRSLLDTTYCDIESQIVDGDCSKIKVEYTHIMSSVVDKIRDKYQSPYDKRKIPITEDGYKKLFETVVNADHSTQSKLLSDMLGITTNPQLSCASCSIDFVLLRNVIEIHFREIQRFCSIQPLST